MAVFSCSEMRNEFLLTLQGLSFIYLLIGTGESLDKLLFQRLDDLLITRVSEAGI